MDVRNERSGSGHISLHNNNNNNTNTSNNTNLQRRGDITDATFS